MEDLLTKEKMVEEEELNVIAKVSKEEKIALQNASSDKKIVRYLVDQYQQSQNYRIRSQNQTRSLMQGFDESDAEQFIFIQKELDNAIAQEALNKKYMDIVTDTIPVCRWMKSITGIGPVISAYLYSAFDVTVGKYSTDFLSYAGLNDNNNPWLGKEKASQIVRSAVAYREEKFNRISEQLQSHCTEAQFKKIRTGFKRISKDEFGFTDIKHVVKNNGKFDLETVSGLDLSILPDYIRSISNPKICDDILIDYVASATGRKFSNVKKGTEVNWSRKSSKTKVPTTDDLAAYLAKPPYNTDLKKKMFIIGDMFIKNSGRDKSLYGKIYKHKKLEYTRKNDNGEYAEQAEEILATKNFGKDTDAYKALSQGKLPAAQINARARRYAVKLFISHVYEAMYYAEYHEEPPQTYVIAIMGHHDYIAPEVDYRPYIDGEL